MKHLTPAFTAEQLYPERVVFMARNSLHALRLYGFQEPMPDRVTSVLMGLLNGKATIRHRACAGPEAMDLFARAGVEVDEELYVYETEKEAKAHALRLIESGHKLLWSFPLPASEYDSSVHYVDVDVYHHLNSKENLGELVSSDHLAARRIMDHDALADLRWSSPVCVKAAGRESTAGGYAVFACFNQNDLDAAKKWFEEHRGDIPAVVVEEWLDVEACWCVNLLIREERTLCIAGVEQLFSSPGKQSGSIMDPEMMLPPAGVELAVRIGETAAKMGYRGIAGLDIGRTVDGRIIFFDPNFRHAASTPQALFHSSAVERSGLPVSLWFQIAPTRPFDEIAQKLHKPIGDGWFIPTRFFNGEKHPRSGGKHTVTGIIMGADRQSALETSKKLEALLME